MGHTVNATKDEGRDDEVSDVGKIIRFLAGLSPAQRREYAHVFHGDTEGALTVTRHRGVEDEILLSWGEGTPWGIINVGSGDRFFADLDLPPEQKRVHDIVNPDWFFANLDHDTSPIHVLVGSRKFAEGWNSYRVGVIGLVNLGKSKGNQIIQIFGRGVRLHGARGDGKRKHTEHLADYAALGDAPGRRLRRLETLVVTSLNPSYLERFLDEIGREVRFLSTRTVRVNPAVVRLGGGETVEWTAYRERLHVFRIAPVEIGWKRAVLEVRDEEQGGAKRRVCDGIRYTVQAGDEEKTGTLRRLTPKLDYRTDPDLPGRDVRIELQRKAFGLGNWLDRVGFTAGIRRAAAGAGLQLWAEQNGVLREPMLEDLLAVPSEVRDREGATLGIERVDALAGRIAAELIPRIAKRIEHQINSRSYRYDGPLEQSTPDRRGDFLYEYTITRSFETQQEQEAWERDRERAQREIDVVVEALHVDAEGRHVYRPLLREPSDKARIERDITIAPDRLNPAERKFVADLGQYIADHYSRQERWEFYLLRNLATLRRIGIYQEDEEQPYFPDFVLWALDREEDRTVLILADPKGQMGMENRRTRENNTKVRLGDRRWKDNPLLELERRLTEEHGRPFELHSFLLLPRSSDWGRGMKAEWIREHMLALNVLRLDWHARNEAGEAGYKPLGKSYLELMFERAGIRKDTTVPAGS
jgi:hypothetical protein